MKKILTFLLVFSVILSGCSQISAENPTRKVGLEEKQDPPSDFIPKKLTVVSVGDSLTQGVGDSTDSGGYIPYLKKGLESEKGIDEVTFYNFGVRGNRTDQLLSRLKTEKVQGKVKQADIVMITIGGNDVMKVFRDNFSNLKLQEFENARIGYQKRLKDILTTIRNENPNAGIVLVGLYNPFIKWFSDVKELQQIVYNWNNASLDILGEFDQTKFVPISDIFENKEEELLYTDYFHPNDKGYKLIADRIFEELKGEKINGLLESNLVVKED
ncbi:SGNH/GDSL hydrolase family protein [Falsibacillus pallidus]|uniref:Lysophospholipase L1-like esterase n=1 Tax=Falsibacillus pallidus TaxID=493781 RepID=A0A370GGZ8_9BACI|nr:SGNH/GDSL hydrolase family protein [Falsibacillus pallidus]RDI43078.1 lysophospholipase L1-like esterase [Falsibacillus pallidus]